MFVPGGWWHAVLNLDDTIAITENVCNQGNFDRVWHRTRKQRKKLAYKWLKILREDHPDAYARALMMNRRDLWKMWVPTWKKSGRSGSSSSSSSTSSEDDEMTLDEISVKHEHDDDLRGSVKDPFLKQLFTKKGKTYEEEIAFLNYINECKYHKIANDMHVIK